jgi:hypothetical protein
MMKEGLYHGVESDISRITTDRPICLLIDGRTACLWVFMHMCVMDAASRWIGMLFRLHD